MLKEFHDLGDQVLILGRWRARGRASGVELENRATATWLYEIKAGKAVRMPTSRTEARPSKPPDCRSRSC